MNNYIDLTVLVSMDLAKIVNGCLYMPDDDGYAVVVSDRVKTIDDGPRKGNWLYANSITVSEIVGYVPKSMKQHVRFELDVQLKTNEIKL